MTLLPTTPPPSRLIAPLGVGMIVSFASSYYLLGVIAEPMATETGASTGRLFAALSGAFLIAAVTSMGAGRWVDRRGGREVLIAASLMLAAALGVMALAQTAAWAIAGVLMLGAGMGVGFYMPANTLLVAVYGMEAKNPIKAVSLIGACGGAIGWPLTMVLIEMAGWREALWFWVGAHVLLCVPLYALLPARRAEASTAIKDAVRWDRRMVQLAVLFAGAWWVATAYAAQLPRLMAALGMEPAAAALAASMMAVAAIGMRVLALITPPRISPVLTVRLASLLNPVGVVVALIGGKGAAVAVAIGQGAGNGLLSVASGILPLHVFGTASYGSRQVAMLLPARFVQAIAPMSFGLALGHSTGFALGVSSAVCVLMFAMTFGLRAREANSPRVAVPDQA